jgi:hypothetical protein
MRATVIGALVVGGLLAGGCGGAGLVALEEARRAALRQPVVAVVEGRERIFLGRGLDVHVVAGRVTTWTRSGLELYWDRHRRCYRATREFNRRDLRDERRQVLPTADGASVFRSGRASVIAWRYAPASDTAPVEGVVVLDRRGRPVLERERSERFGAIPATRWSVERIEYPALAAVPPAPVPRCRPHR